MRCGEKKKESEQLIVHISHSGPVKTALKDVKSIGTRTKVGDGSALTLNTEAACAHCPAV